MNAQPLVSESALGYDIAVLFSQGNAFSLADSCGLEAEMANERNEAGAPKIIRLTEVSSGESTQLGESRLQEGMKSRKPAAMCQPEPVPIPFPSLSSDNASKGVKTSKPAHVASPQPVAIPVKQGANQAPLKK